MNIYAKILENDNISYKVEYETYLLDEGKTYYTPDFFLFQDLNLYEIVEIRGHRFNLEERVESLAKLREILSKDIKLTLLTELDLREMCSDRGMSYNSLKTEWRENPNNIKGSNQGRANPMYGKVHKEETRKLLSEIRQQAIAEDPQKYKEIGERLAEWSRQNDWAHSKGKRVDREVLVCHECGIEFIATPGEIRQGRRFCSGECSRTHNSRAAAKVAIERRENRDIEMKEFILEWAADNREVVQKAPFNRITPTLKPLLEQIEEIYGVKDFRTISRSFDTTSRKVLLQKLKDYVQ